MCFQRACDWTLNIIFWGAIALLISAYAVPLSLTSQIVSIIFISLSGLIYYINGFCFSHMDYFRNLTDVSDISREMNKIFRTPPKVMMSIMCYHYGTRGYESGSIIRTIGSKKLTHRNEQGLKYQSWRDISGTFMLDTSQATEKENVAYVKLKLSTNISFANDGSGEDFERIRTRFKKENLYDDHQDYQESFYLEDLVESYMVQVTDAVPFCFGPGYFTWWTIFAFHAPYTTYVDRYCYAQECVVKKVISTRQDLNNEEMNKLYKYYNARMITRGQTIVFGGTEPKFLPAPPQGYLLEAQPKEVLFIPFSQYAEQPSKVLVEKPGGNTAQEPLSQSQSQIVPLPGPVPCELPSATNCAEGAQFSMENQPIKGNNIQLLLTKENTL
eukprot:TRINITY_DN71084_c0_g1_i1.p1 TRINITY_DN71084_c0_g1~~TRINITY_DN71084_c0_g1_i1.p1  ORF type:complete len:385 (+),score=9.78 TRINITY_DN71084_c0_g1_i1:143-1297(+)